MGNKILAVLTGICFMLSAAGDAALAASGSTTATMTKTKKQSTQRLQKNKKCTGSQIKTRTQTKKNG